MKLNVISTERSCGECNACCKPFPVPEVGKHDGSWCHHCIKDKGCAIYDTRPEACRNFVCLWLYGKGDDSLRPDKSGFMMVAGKVQLGDRLIPVLYLLETRPGGLDQPIIQVIVDGNNNAGLIVVSRRIYDETRFKTSISKHPKHHRDITYPEIEAVLSRGKNT